MRERTDEELVTAIARGLSPAQVAQALGISAVAARVRLMRSRARLQQAMTVAGFGATPTPQLAEEHTR